MQQLRILVGDNGTHFARGFVASLRVYGCICSVHHQSLTNIVRSAVEEQPDAIVIDTSESAAWHYELFKQLQRSTQSAVFVVTSVHHYGEKAGFLREGVVAVFQKPVEAALMLREIARYVYGAQTYVRYRATTIETIVSDYLQQLGAASNMSGFRYLHAILCRTVEEPTLVHGICTKLYSVIAEEYHVNVPCVERNIRTLLMDLWDHTNAFVLSEALHYPAARLHNRLPNAKFIAGATEALRMDSRVQLFLEDDFSNKWMPTQIQRDEHIKQAEQDKQEKAWEL